MKLKLLIVILLHIWFGSTSFSQKANTSKPNIILIMGDDLTYNDIEPYGSRQVKTPNLAALAKQGMCFDNMFSASSACAPARQQLLTGVYPVRNGAHPNHSRVYDGTRSVAHHMQELGYNTALIGKRHYSPEESYPFLFLSGRNNDNGQGIDIELDKAEAFVNNNKDKPYFLIVTSNQPHSPATRGNPAAYPPEKIRLNPGFIDTDITRKSLSKYYAEITYMDSCVGVVMDIAKRSGRLDNTIIIFLTEQGSGTVPFAKWTLYDAGLKTGCIIKYPGKVKPGSRNSALTQDVDIVPTLVDIAGGDPTKINTGVKDATGYRGFDGKSFKNVLLGKSNELRNVVFGIQTTRGIINGSESYPIRSARNKNYLFIHNLQSENAFQNVVTKSPLYKSWLEKDPKRAKQYQYRPEEELYDVVKDPYQLNNLAAKPSLKNEKEKLKKELAAFMKQQGDKGIATEMDADNRQPKNSASE